MILGPARPGRTPPSSIRLLASVELVTAVLITVACSGHDPAAAPGDTVTGGLPLTVVTDVRLPGNTSRFDYQDVDPEARRLYIAHLGDGTVHVVDLDQLTVVATVDNVASAHGVRLAPDLHRVYASATGTNEVVGIDTVTNQVVSRAPTGRFPDGIAYEPQHNEVYVSNQHDTVETVIDGRTGEPLTTITIGGEAGNSTYDAATGNVLVNVQDKGHIAVIDPTTHTVTGTIATPGCESNHGLYVVADPHVAFVACEDNAKLVVIDLDTRAVIDSYDVGGTPDVLAFDPGLRRLYVAGESGTVSVFEVHGTTLRKMGETKLAGSAHTVAVDPTTHRVYFPLEDVDGHPVLRVMEPTDGG